MPVPKPLVSVLIPSFNYGRFIAYAVDSVLNQTYPNVEVVVTDNGSTDETMTVLARYTNDPRVRVFVNETNIGLVPNFNRGLRHARGEFIAWLSADDWFFPSHIATVAGIFERHPWVDVAYTGAYMGDEGARIYDRRAMPGQFPVDELDHRDMLFESVTTNCPMCLPTGLFPRRLIDELGPLDERIPVAADWEWNIRLALAGKRFAYIAAPSVGVRMHGAQASGAAFYGSGRTVIEFLTIIKNILDDPRMARIEGRYRHIGLLLQGLVSVAITINNGVSPFTPAELNLLNAYYARLNAPFTRHWATVRDRTVNVVVPSAGRLGLLAEALDSLEAQTYGPWRAIIVDNGGIPIADWIAARPHRERYTVLRVDVMRSPGAARNLALRMTRGPLVAYLDEDNVFAPGHLETLVKTLERSNAAVAFAESALEIERRPVDLLNRRLELRLTNVYRGASDPPELSRVANAIPLNAVMHDIRVTDDFPFNEQLPLLEDFEFLLRAMPGGIAPCTGESTLTVRMRVGLPMHQLSAWLPNYCSLLEQAHGAYPAAAEIESMRAEQRQLLLTTLQRPNIANSSDGLAEMLGVMAGRFIRRAPLLA